MAYLNDFMNSEKRKDFEIWAFGKSPIYFDIAAMNMWNEKHGEELFLKGEYSVPASLEQMIEIYEKSLA